HKILHRLLQD
nr:Chain C, 10-mer peptide from Nuclear receptor coactivator 2 [synthetic construct]1UHL_D Chain D, 10-mer peptide from Nuclear receptor coactivator 2 [synthetic construct]3PCU_B Chain B, Nuclear receptor coactivator 2 [Homo sapiens]3R5M_B Chain B, Nuclear receptor coactivator 2 [Homo sapiens]3R5M_D Chain D, Nuclear receptor coactivator 2 [Homo sapiens]4IU7_C Chain C, Nuclear receptor coactivator 2 [Homo sapiens]4IU7_D Chain D, Nuclear receptor coactivator 2 [Homo sapiens]4IUI_C Chain C, Nuc